MRALNTIGTAISAQFKKLNAIANNLANAQTHGYKKQNMIFTDLMYTNYKNPGYTSQDSAISPIGVQIGSGTEIIGTARNYQQGDISQNNDPLSLAIEGDGFFEIILPDQTRAYTRDGKFTIDSTTNQIVNAQGYVLSPGISIDPRKTNSIKITENGMIKVPMDDDNTQYQTIGEIQLADFPNKDGLLSAGGGLLFATEASGAPLYDIGTSTRLKQGCLEKSNIDIFSELADMMEAQLMADNNSTMLKSLEKIYQKMNDATSV